MKTTTQRVSILLLAAASAAAALTGVAGCASTATQESTGQYMDDTAITAKVKTAIFNDASLKSAEINVETFKGVVQLSGFVNSATDIQHAVQLVQGISGVRSVRNDMRLK
jgi:osmotically-inducible protein OsmY